MMSVHQQHPRDHHQQQQQQAPPIITIYNGDEEDIASGQGRVLAFDIVTPHVSEELISNDPPTEDSMGRQEGAYIVHVETLLQALHDVTKLACMDTAEYEASLSSNSQQQNQHAALSPAVLSPLIQAIHRLHANVAVARAEQDHQAVEIQALHEQVSALQQQERKLQKAIAKVIKQTDSCQAALEQANLEKCQLQQQLKKVVHRIKESEYQHKELIEWNTAYKLQAHEMVLSSCNLNNRVRLASTDSNFSELEALDFYKCASANNTTTTTCEGESVSSVSSHCSFVTEEGIATVRFPEPPITTVQQQEDVVESYTIDYPVGSKLGIHILALALPRERGILTEAILSMKEEEPKPFRWGSLLGKPTPTVERNGFYVSEVVEKRLGMPSPKVGARIISINSVPIEPTWTLSKVLDALHGKGSCEDIVRVLYRHDELTEEQREVLFKDSEKQEYHSDTEVATPNVKEEESVQVKEKNEAEMDPSCLNMASTNATSEEEQSSGDRADQQPQQGFAFVPFWQKNENMPVENDSQADQTTEEKHPDRPHNLHGLERLNFWNKKDGKKERLAQPLSKESQTVEKASGEKAAGEKASSEKASGEKASGEKASGEKESETSLPNNDNDADFQPLESSEESLQEKVEDDIASKSIPHHDKNMHERLQNVHTHTLDRLTFWNKEGRAEGTVANQSVEQTEASSSDVENEALPRRPPTPIQETHPSRARKVGPSFGTTMTFTNPFKMQ